MSITAGSLATPKSKSWAWTRAIRDGTLRTVPKPYMITNKDVCLVIFVEHDDDYVEKYAKVICHNGKMLWTPINDLINITEDSM